jgi:hypothetical protein
MPKYQYWVLKQRIEYNEVEIKSCCAEGGRLDKATSAYSHGRP